MQTLHDMLKRTPSREDHKRGASEDLGRRYSKIGISAVAAAAQFSNPSETKVTQLAGALGDRSSARGWSGHR